MLTTLYPKTIATHKDYSNAVTILQWWSICYYQFCYDSEDMPQVPDAVNDHLYRMVEAYEKANPDKINQDSTTQHVGYGEILDDAIKAIIRAKYIQVQDKLIAKKENLKCL